MFYFFVGKLWSYLEIKLWVGVGVLYSLIQALWWRHRHNQSTFLLRLYTFSSCELWLAWCRMVQVYRRSSLAMWVGHITVPSLFKVHKLVPSLGPKKFQETTSSKIGHLEKAFTYGYLGDYSHRWHQLWRDKISQTCFFLIQLIYRWDANPPYVTLV